VAKKKVEWLFELLDKVSGPVDKIGASLDRVSGKFDKLSKLRDKLAKPFKMGSPSGGGSTESKFADKLGGIGTTIGVAAAGMAALGVAGVGFALSTASAKTNLGLALTNILGTKEAATAVAGQIAKLAATTPFESQDVSKSVKALLAVGYAADQSFEVFKALGDATAMDGFDPAQLEGLTRAMTKLKGEGKLTGEVLAQLNDSSGGMVGKGRVIEQLVKITGKSTDQVQKMLSAGKIDAAVGTKAILETIRVNLSGGTLGGAMNKMAQEIPGLLSTLKDNLGAELVPDIDSNAGFSAVRGMLRSVVAASDQAKPFLQQAFGRLFTAVLGGGGELTNAQGTFEAIFAAIGRGVNVVAGVIETVTPYARAFAYGFLVGLQRVRDSLAPVGAVLSKVFGGASGGETLINIFVRLGQGLAIVLAIGAGVIGFLGGVIGFVSAVGVAVVSAVVAIIGVASDLIDLWSSFSLVEIGSQLMAGLAAGITGGLSSVLDTVAGAGQSVIDKVKQVFGIHSPSKVFEELGRYTSEGFQIGVEGGQPGVQGAYQTTLAPSVPATTAAAGGASSGMGGGVAINVGDVIVNARTGASPQEIAAAVEAMLTSKVALEIERIASSIGYSPAEA
jgi:tape measure domain-containing protein